MAGEENARDKYEKRVKFQKIKINTADSQIIQIKYI